MAKITDLPIELLALIFQRSNFTDVPLEKSFFRNPLRICLVCRAWKEFAQKMLLYSICLSEHDIVNGIRSGPGKQLQLYPHLGKYVKVLYLSFHAGTLIRLSKEQSSNMRGYLESIHLEWLENVLKCCTELKSLHVEEILGIPRCFLFVLNTVSPTIESIEWSLETETVEESMIESASINLDQLWSALERHPRLKDFSLTAYSSPTPLFLSEVLVERPKIQLNHLELYFHSSDSSYNWTSKLLSLTDSTTLESLQITLPEANFDFTPDVINFSQIKAITIELESDLIVEQQTFYSQILSILPQCTQLSDLNLLCATSHKPTTNISTQLFNSIPSSVIHLAVEFCDQEDQVAIIFWVNNRCPNLIEFRTRCGDDEDENEEQNLVVTLRGKLLR